MEICSLGLAVKDSIYDYEERLERCNGEIALRFLNYLTSPCLNTVRVSKIAGHVPGLAYASWAMWRS
jgi:hypothetical protein